MSEFNNFLEKIKKEEIKPTPKWKFSLKSLFIWLLYFLFVLIGSISFSVILFAIQQTDFVLLSHTGHSKLELFLAILPFIWIILLVVFVLGSIYAIYNSNKGYKFTFSKIIGFNVGLSILFGTLFFIGGGAQWFENAFAIRSGFYESIQTRKEKIWQNPDKGNIAGTIIKVEDKIIHLKDFDNNTWKVIIDTAFIPPSVFLEKGEKIKIVGKKLSSDKFNAKDVMPWGGKGQREKMKKRRNKMKQNNINN